jgi:hypothetical protein
MIVNGIKNQESDKNKGIKNQESENEAYDTSTGSKKSAMTAA